jgi:hypothetical protein
MPLPAALQQRLLKRGLIKSSTESSYFENDSISLYFYILINIYVILKIGTVPKKRANDGDDDEEIIAESYDEPTIDKSNKEVSNWI